VTPEQGFPRTRRRLPTRASTLRRRPPVPEQLDRLFATFRDPVRNAEYTYEQVAETIARAGGPTISANYLYMLRRGVRDNPTKKHLEALAGFFRVSPGYFFGHAGSDQLSRELDLVAALRDSRVRDLAQTASGMSEETLAIIHRLVERTLHGVESTRVPNGTEATGAFLSQAAIQPDALTPQSMDYPNKSGLDPTQLQTSERVQLEISYAKLALDHGAAEDVLLRLSSLLATENLDRDMEDEAVYLLAKAHEKTNNLDEAARLLLPVYERCLRSENGLSITTVSLSLCGFYLRSQDLDASVRVAEKGLQAAREQGLEGTDEHLRLAATLMWAHLELGNLLHCMATADHLLETAKKAGSAQGRGAIYWNAALAADARGRVHEALCMARQALACLSEQENRRDLPRLHTAVAWVLLRAAPERAQEAALLLDQALPALKDLGGRHDLAMWACVRGRAHLALEESVPAEALVRQAIPDLLDPEDRAWGLITLGDAVAAQGRVEEGAAHYRDAAAALDGTRVSRGLAQTWRELAERLNWLDDPTALDLYRQALDATGVPSYWENTRRSITAQAGMTAEPRTPAQEAASS
jgi:tetratricopeptide (TPR) repeat protein/transcriptional regulator with XRE-family HTH domain